MEILIYLSSGLFLGWTLGANDAANIFGTAVGTRMLRFRTAAIIGGVFVILGAGLSGSGAAYTLEKLGAVNEIAGAFVVALAAAGTVYWMTKLNLPVSTSQAVVGSIIGWNIFSGSLIDYSSLTRIVLSWILSPVIAALFSMFIYFLVKRLVNRLRVHLLTIDFYNRLGLILVGAFGSYSLGANNIANVMGVFVPVSPFTSVNINCMVIGGAEQLFILGGLAIAVGIFTYSYRVMMTVGNDIVSLTPMSALIVVFSSSLVMFIFASQELQFWLLRNRLPALPLVPLSSSQVIVGAVIGIGLIRGGRGINYRVLSRIGSGWITTPLVSGLICLVSLFVLQNVFHQKVYRPVSYRVTEEIMEIVKSKNINENPLLQIKGKRFLRADEFKEKIKSLYKNSGKNGNRSLEMIIRLSEIHNIRVDIRKLKTGISDNWISEEQMRALENLDGRNFTYAWKLQRKLAHATPRWKLKDDVPENIDYNRDLRRKSEYLNRIFRSD
jgi:inorganic phosphate transporter, PiT family